MFISTVLSALGWTKKKQNPVVVTAVQEYCITVLVQGHTSTWGTLRGMRGRPIRSANRRWRMGYGAVLCWFADSWSWPLPLTAFSGGAGRGGEGRGGDFWFLTAPLTQPMTMPPSRRDTDETDVAFSYSAIPHSKHPMRMRPHLWFEDSTACSAAALPSVVDAVALNLGFSKRRRFAVLDPPFSRFFLRNGCTFPTYSIHAHKVSRSE
jgi:hypothetical protein